MPVCFVIFGVFDLEPVVKNRGPRGRRSLYVVFVLLRFFRAETRFFWACREKQRSACTDYEDGSEGCSRSLEFAIFAIRLISDFGVT